MDDVAMNSRIDRLLEMILKGLGKVSLGELSEEEFRRGLDAADDAYVDGASPPPKALLMVALSTLVCARRANNVEGFRIARKQYEYAISTDAQKAFNASKQKEGGAYKRTNHKVKRKVLDKIVDLLEENPDRSDYSIIEECSHIPGTNRCTLKKHWVPELKPLAEAHIAMLEVFEDLTQDNNNQ